MDIQSLLGIHPGNFRGQNLPTEEILRWFGVCEAYWSHNGDARAPHALLTSGKHSNAFFDCLRVLEYVNLSEILANQLAIQIRSVIGRQKVDWVIASPMAGITFGHDVARALGATRFFFTEKDPADKDKMLWNRRSIPAGETVLQIEELITTAKTLNAVQSAVDAGNKYPVTWLPYIGTLVHRPEKLDAGGGRQRYGQRHVIALIEQEVWTAEQKDCPLCVHGSVAIRPKQDKNWDILTGKLPLSAQSS